MNPLALACPRCQTPQDPADEKCARCGGSLLVNVRLVGGLPPPKARYQLLQHLATLPGVPPNVGLLLNEPRPMIARGLTRDQATGLERTLAAWAVAVAVEPVDDLGAARSTKKEPRRWLGLRGVLTVVVLGGLGAAAWYVQDQGLLGTPAQRHAWRRELDRKVSLRPSTTPEKARESVVAVRCEDASALGFFVSPRTIVTTMSRCPKAEALKVRQLDGVYLEASILADDAEHNLLALWADSRGEVLELDDPLTVEPGDPLVALTSTAKDWVPLSTRAVRVGVARGGIGYLELQGALPGVGGGPVLDQSGRVVAVLVGSDHAADLSYALPVTYLFDGSGAAWQAGPRGMLTAEWRAYVEAARADPAKPLQLSPPLPAGATPPRDPRPHAPAPFEVAIASAKWTSVENEVEVVVVTVDPRPDDRWWVFDLDRGGDRLCTMTRTKVLSWQPLAQSTEPLGPLETTVRGEGSRRLFVGKLQAQWGSCERVHQQPRGDLSLAFPKASGPSPRVPIQP